MSNRLFYGLMSVPVGILIIVVILAMVNRV